MGQCFQKIVVFLLFLGLFSCTLKNSSCYEYNFFVYERGIPIIYTSILQKINGREVKQVRYSGEINNKYDSIYSGHFPDSSQVGYSRLGKFGYRRWGDFQRLKYDKDSLTQCFCFDIQISIKLVQEDKNLLENTEYIESCLELNYEGKDTIFNNILPVNEFNKYIFYKCDDTNFLNGYYDIYIDLQRCLLVYFFRKSSLNNVDSHDYKYEIVRFRKISNQYFNEIWYKSKEDKSLNCSPF